jgi:hypothetical protein
VVKVWKCQWRGSPAIAIRAFFDSNARRGWVACAQQDKQEKPKQKVRRWSFGKLAGSEDKEPEKKRDDGNHREKVLSNSKFAMYMYPSQEEWAAVVIQTAFRGYLVGAG